MAAHSLLPRIQQPDTCTCPSPAILIQSTLPHHTSWRAILMLCSNAKVLQIAFPSRFLRRKSVCISVFLPTSHILHLSHPSWFDHYLILAELYKSWGPSLWGFIPTHLPVAVTLTHTHTHTHTYIYPNIFLRTPFSNIFVYVPPFIRRTAHHIHIK